MPTLTRWFVKSSLVYFIAALIIASALALQAPLNLSSAIGGLMPVYLHLFMVSWITQFIFGVIYWMFPRFSKEKTPWQRGTGLGHLWPGQRHEETKRQPGLLLSC